MCKSLKQVIYLAHHIINVTENPNYIPSLQPKQNDHREKKTDFRTTKGMIRLYLNLNMTGHEVELEGLRFASKSMDRWIGE